MDCDGQWVEVIPQDEGNVLFWVLWCVDSPIHRQKSLIWPLKWYGMKLDLGKPLKIREVILPTQ